MFGARVRVGRWPLVSALAVLAVLASAANAVAGTFSGSFANPPVPVMRFTVAATNGYRLYLFASVRHSPSSKAPVSLTAESHHEIASYEVLGTVTPHRIHASFGKLGIVSLRFSPTGRVLRYRCLSGGPQARATTHVGVFSGSVRFDGERGYTHARATQIRGGFGNPLAPLNARQSRGPCLPHHSPAHPDRPAPSSGAQVIFSGSGLQAFYNGPRHNHAVTFSAAPLHRAAPEGTAKKLPTVLFFATSSQRRGRIAVTREVIRIGGEASLRFLDAKRTIAVKPPPPFSGSATFRQGGDEPATWLGSLGVPFPGRSTERLAGPAFRASYESEGFGTQVAGSSVNARCETDRLQARGQFNFKDATFPRDTLLKPCIMRR